MTTGSERPRQPTPMGAYPSSRRVGNLLFLSGIGSRMPGSNEVPGNMTDAAGQVIQHDIAKQCHQVFANVRAALEDAGSSWDRIVDVTVFLTDMQNDFPIYNRIYAEYFHTNQPTRTTVEVGALPSPIAIELKVIAEVG